LQDTMIELDCAIRAEIEKLGSNPHLRQGSPRFTTALSFAQYQKKTLAFADFVNKNQGFGSGSVLDPYSLSC